MWVKKKKNGCFPAIKKKNVCGHFVAQFKRVVILQFSQKRRDCFIGWFGKT